MARLRPHPVSALCIVTLAIWGNRIWLAWTNDEDTLARKLVWSLPITLFVIAAVVLLVAIWRGTDPSATPFRRAVLAFAGGTIVYWLVRAPMIVLADHPAPFKVVHAVLALASWAAAGWALRWAMAGPEGNRIADPHSGPSADASGAGLGYSGDAR